MTMPDPPGLQTVAPGQTISSDWGNAVWKQSVVRFTDAAQRDSQWPDPPDGAVCFIESFDGYMIRRSDGWWRTQMEIFPANALAGVETVPNRMWLVAMTTVVTTNDIGQYAIAFNNPGAVLYTSLVTVADDPSPAPTATTFDYHTTYCQGIYSRSGTVVANSGVRLNVIAVMGN